MSSGEAMEGWLLLRGRIAEHSWNAIQYHSGRLISDFEVRTTSVSFSSSKLVYLKECVVRRLRPVHQFQKASVHVKSCPHSCPYFSINVCQH